MWFVGSADQVCPQEKVVVAVMAELRDDMLVCVIPHVMWCLFPFNKSFSNLISVTTIM